MGSLAGKFGNIEEGVRECWVAAKLQPGWELPLVEIGIIYLNANRSEEARAHLEELAEGREDASWHLLYNLGEARRRCGETSQALDAFTRGLELNPTHPPMLDSAADCAFLVGKGALARRLMKQANWLGSSQTYLKWEQKKYRKQQRRKTK